jgi:ribonucleoside-diphosphate reductase alpha chain
MMDRGDGNGGKTVAQVAAESACTCALKGDPFKAPEQHARGCPERERLEPHDSDVVFTKLDMTGRVWREAEVELRSDDGREVVKRQKVRVPRGWSDRAALIAASKYLRGEETGVDELFERVVSNLARWAVEDGYIGSEVEDVKKFHDDLMNILLDQQASFNSPVYFNVGVEERPQCSACFILSVDDHMESILKWYRDEGIIFKYGSGSGVNLSKLRSSGEKLSRSSGKASGPLSFMKAADASAGVIKSGGKTRRAAKMVVLNASHPDIEDFIWCKVREEEKARALIAAGYGAGIDGEAHASVFFQNANNSVMVTDDFMHAVEADADWELTNITDGKIAKTVRARELFRQVADAAWACGDPGLLFDSTIQDWHTCPNAGRINATNPCAEHVHLDNSACNLASLRLTKFLNDDGSLDIPEFKRVVDVMITAMDVIVGRASYPTPQIEQGAHAYRQLGLGYADLGAALMRLGLAYDSDDGRAWAASVTALLCGEAYLTSARLAEKLGPFSGYEKDQVATLKVLIRHTDAAGKLPGAQEFGGDALAVAAFDTWKRALAQARKTGVRNSQVVNIAPTGTIALLMDCDTTGVEPDLSLIKEKRLVGGGTLKIVNESVAPALFKLGYTPQQVAAAVETIKMRGTLEELRLINDEDLPVFDCAFAAIPNGRSISPEGHVAMVAAVQPFVSGGVSKTVNLPATATAEDIERFYLSAWRQGLKSISVYRDGCKAGDQPLSVAGRQAEKHKNLALMYVDGKPRRRRLPDERKSLTHKFEISGVKGYITAGLYDDGMPGEIFITMSKQGSTVAGFVDAFATAVSFGLQYGVPLEFYVRKFEHTRFEPAGFTKHADIPQARSIPDYCMRWLGLRFLPNRPAAQDAAPSGAASGVTEAAVAAVTERVYGDSPSCGNCGELMVRAGSCYLCRACGETSGC